MKRRFFMAAKNPKQTVVDTVREKKNTKNASPSND